MKTSYILISLTLLMIPALFSFRVSAQSTATRTNTSTNMGGTATLWTTASSWRNSIVPIATTAVTFSSSATAAIRNNTQVTIASFRASGNDQTLRIDAGSSLTVNGNFALNDKSRIHVYGSLTINGNMSFKDDSQVTVYSGGSLTVNGNITGDGWSEWTLNGTTTVTGNITLGTENDRFGTSPINLGGTCYTQSGTFCSNNKKITPLPVTLQSFTSESHPQGVALHWTTATEKNSSHFLIEKSVDGQSFHLLTTVKAMGNAVEAHHYNTVDTQPSRGFNYYRLTAVDLDNTRETFQVIQHHYQGAQDFRANPNPANGDAIRFLLNFAEEQGTITIVNTLGAPVATIAVRGSRDIVCPATLASGTYLATYASNTYTQTIRLMVK